MNYRFDFAPVAEQWNVLLVGLGLTLQLTVVGAIAGLALGTLCAWVRTSRMGWARFVVGCYVEFVRNTPFLIQLFVIFFGLPSLGFKLSPMQAGLLTVTLNLGAYSAEIIRAGIQATPRGQYEAGESLAMTRAQIFRYIVLKPALGKVWPALTSQIVLVMLGTAACSQISIDELTLAANFISSRNFRAFETYLVVTALYFGLAVGASVLLDSIGRRLFNAGKTQ